MRSEREKYKEIRALIGQGKTEDAVNKLSDLRLPSSEQDKPTLFSGRYNTLKNDRILDILNRNDYDSRLSQLNMNILSWISELEGQNNTQEIPLFLKDFCDRIEQEIAFSQIFEQRKKSQDKFQYYLLYCPERQSDVGLYRRFVRKFMSDPQSKLLPEDKIIFVKACDVNYLTSQLFEKFFGYGSSPDSDSPDPILKSFLESYGSKDIPTYIAIKFSIKYHLFKTCQPAGIEHLMKSFINLFCQETVLENRYEHVRFVFFWSLGYPSETQGQSSFFSSWFRPKPKDHLSEIREQLSVPEGFDTLPKLEKIEYQDIKNWFQETFTQIGLSNIKIENLRLVLFPEERAYDMDEVEYSLEKAILDYPKLLKELEQAS